MDKNGAVVARYISFKMVGLLVDVDELDPGIFESEVCGDTEGRIVVFSANVGEGVKG